MISQLNWELPLPSHQKYWKQEYVSNLFFFWGWGGSLKCLTQISAQMLSTFGNPQFLTFFGRCICLSSFVIQQELAWRKWGWGGEGESALCCLPYRLPWEHIPPFLLKLCQDAYRQDDVQTLFSTGREEYLKIMPLILNKLYVFLSLTGVLFALWVLFGRDVLKLLGWRMKWNCWGKGVLFCVSLLKAQCYCSHQRCAVKFRWVPLKRKVKAVSLLCIDKL